MCLQNVTAQTYNINTVAGNGAQGSTGDGGVATAAKLYFPNGVTKDASGNIYIADASNNVIRKVSTIGIITTVVGTIGISPGYSGDGGQATAAKLNNDLDVAFDNAGNMYIADYGNNVIRKVSTGGIISTVAGNSIAGYSGDGGQATAAKLNGPNGVVVDASGNMYIAEYLNNVIRKVSASGIISTVAGDSIAGYSGDGGQATVAELNGPAYLAFNASGNLYFSDFGNNVIREVNTTSGIITTVAGNVTGTAGYSGDGGAATNAMLSSPNGVNFDASGNMYIGDAGNNVIRKISTSGIITTIAGNTIGGFSGDGAAATAAKLNTPVGITSDASGNIYIADVNNERIRELTTTVTAPIAYFTASPTTLCAGGTVQFTDTSAANPTTWQWTFAGGTPNTSTLQNPSIAYNTASIYSVKLKVTNSAGADSITKASYITVNALPTTSISGLSAMCTGTIDTLIDHVGGTAPFTWSWSTSATTSSIEVFTANTYSVTVFDGNGCSNTATATVTVNPLPTITITGNDSASIGHPDILTATGGGSYLWTTGSTHDTTIVSPTVATTYSVKVTDSLGCSAVDSFKVSIKVITTGIATLTESNGTNLYPNPANTLLNLSFTMQGSSTNATINVLDITGKSLLQTSTEISNGKTLPINISQLPAGIYFVRIATEKNTQTIKFVKQDN